MLEMFAVLTVIITNQRRALWELRWKNKPLGVATDDFWEVTVRNLS